MVSKSKAKRYRACAELLPPPGNEVVAECLDEIERLQAASSLRHSENERLRGYFYKYAKHRHDEDVFCDKLKHDDYPCTCGFDEARQALDNEESAYDGER